MTEMGWFDSFRDDGRNTYYSSQRMAVWADVTQIIVIIVCCVVVTALIIVVLGTRGKERLTTFLRASFTLHTGIALLLTLYSQQWLVTSGHTRCPYMVGRHNDISAYVTISVGLNSINITLQGELNETQSWGNIHYNEEYSFSGVYDMAEGLLDAKEHGLPDTILYIVEYFSADTGDLRWCRHLRGAGRFTGILLWASFAMWIVYNIVLCFVVMYGAVMMTLSGLTMTTACALYHFLQPPTPLTIPFDDTYVEFKYGWCLFVALISGVVTLITGVALMLLCRFSPVGVSNVFMIDLSDLEYEHEDNKGSMDESTGTHLDFRKRSSHVYDNKAFAPSGSSLSPDVPPTPLSGGGSRRASRNSVFEWPAVKQRLSSPDEYTELPAITIESAPDVTELSDGNTPEQTRSLLDDAMSTASQSPLSAGHPGPVHTHLTVDSIDYDTSEDEALPKSHLSPNMKHNGQPEHMDQKRPANVHGSSATSGHCTVITIPSTDRSVTNSAASIA